MRYWWNRKFYFYKFKKIYEKQSTDYLYIFVKRINNKIINSTKSCFFYKSKYRAQRSILSTGGGNGNECIEFH